MRSKRLSILVSCLVITIVLVFVFLHHHRHERVAAVPPLLPTVAVIAARDGTIANQLSVAGIFQPFQDVDVHGKVSGYIRHIYVDIGDRVHEGQTLAVLEVPELDAEVAGAILDDLLALGATVSLDSQTDLLKINSEYTASLILAR